MPGFDDLPRIWTGEDVFTEEETTSTDLIVIDETPQLPSVEVKLI